MAMFVDLHDNHLWLSVFGIVGTILSSIFIILTPMTTFIQIYRARSTMGFDSMPYVSALFSFMLWMYYAYIKENYAIFLISMSTVGTITVATYIIIFLIFASSQAMRGTLNELLICIGGFCLIFLVSWFPFSGEILESVVGWASVVSSMAVFASPLCMVLHVLETRSVEFLPVVYLTIILSFSSIMWLGYGLLLRDMCIALPSALGFSLGFIQILLHAIYWEPNPVIEQNEYVAEHVMNVEMLQTTHNNQLVHPAVDSTSLSVGATQTNSEANQGE